MTTKNMLAALDTVDATHPATMEMARQARRNQRLAANGDEIEAALAALRATKGEGGNLGEAIERASRLADVIDRAVNG